MSLHIQKGKSFNLKQLRIWGREKFDFNKEFQRSKAWSKERQQRLLDSVIKNLSIGALILRKTGDKFEILDGQQRLQTIFDFIEGKDNLITSSSTEEFPEKRYEDLAKDPQRSADFDSFKVIYDEIYGGTDQEIADIFLRLQEGVPLNVAEKLNATIGKIRNFVYDVSKHPLFKKGVKIGEYRFAHRMLAAQITLLELESKLDHEPYPEFPDLRFEQFKKMYNEYRLNVPKKLYKGVYGTINFLYSSLGQDAKVLRKKSDVPILYSFASYLRKKYVLNPKLFRDFVIEFFTNVAQARIKEEEPAKNPFEKYIELRRKGLTLQTFTERFNLLLGSFLNKATNIRLKGKKRFFDVGQKLAIYYYKNNKTCQYCRKEVSWDDADFHHIEFYRKGGFTTVENGQLMHKDCHKKFHQKEGKDSDI
jgi:hypothetical protein